MDTVDGALLVGGVTGVVALVGHLVSPAVAKWREGREVASALLGELEAHRSAVPKIREGLVAIEARVRAGSLAEIYTRDWKIPTDPIYERYRDKVGTLSPETAAAVIGAYQRIQAFRESAWAILREGADLPANQVLALCQAARSSIDGAEECGMVAAAGLRKRTAMGFVAWCREPSASRWPPVVR